MPPSLTTDQLEAVQRLICEPLRQAVRAEMQAGHEQVTAAVAKLADQLAAHVNEAIRRDRAQGARIDLMEHRIGTLERFRGRVLVVYGVLTLIFSFAWSVLREWLLEISRRR